MEKCLESVSNLDFPKSDYEVIVVDDGSTDGTREFLGNLNRENWHIFLRDHGGPAKARNYGVQNAVGSYIAFTDDDCLVPVDWLEKLQAGFNKWLEACAVGGYLEALPQVLKSKLAAKLESYETRKVYKAGDTEYLGGFESPAGGTNNIAYRKDIFEKLGGFDESFPEPAGEDADLKFRAVKENYKIGYIPVKVTHLDPYSFKTFLKRSVRFGIGSMYFEKKNYGVTPSLLLLLTGSLKLFFSFSVIGFFVLVRDNDENKVKLARNLRGLFINCGKLKYINKI